MTDLEKMCKMIYDDGEVVSYNSCMTYDLRKIEIYLILCDGEYYTLNKFDGNWNSIHHELMKQKYLVDLTTTNGEKERGKILWKN